jgi:hypothetical protein
MGFHLTANTTGAPLTPPTRDDGTGYPLCMYYRGDTEVAFADTYRDLVEVLLPDYRTLLEASEMDAAVARIELAAAAATIIQAHLLAETNPDDLTDTDRAHLTAPRIGSHAPHPDWWTHPTPLVVVTTSYAPYTDLPRPASGISDTHDAPNLWWIDPTSEETLLTTLHDVGYLRLMHATTTEPSTDN